MNCRYCALALVCCALVGDGVLLAQTTAPRNATGTTNESPRGQADRRQEPTRVVNNDSAQDAGAAMRRNGSSLLKATLNVKQDRAQARLADVSFGAVPEPQPRTLRKHDQITIIVREESAFSSKGTSEMKKQADFSARLDEFIKLKIRNAEIEGGGIGGPVPSVRATGTRNFKGEGTVDRSDSFTTRVQAEVVDVKPNGTLVLQARSHIKTDEEERSFVLTGCCRVEDVNADNTILSTQLFDKDLRHTSKGNVRESTRRGWLSHLLDAVSPF